MSYPGFLKRFIESCRPSSVAQAASFLDKDFLRLIVHGLYFVALVMCNYLAFRMCKVGDLVFGAGSIPYAVTFLLGNVICETEGAKQARRFCAAGSLSYLFVIVLELIGFGLRTLAGGRDHLLVIPGGEEAATYLNSLNAVYDTFVTPTRFKILFGSWASFTLCSLLNVAMFERLSEICEGKSLWLRATLSTFAAQTGDTLIFVCVSFSGTTTPHALLLVMVFGHLLVKWWLTFLALPLVMLLVLRLKPKWTDLQFGI